MPKKKSARTPILNKAQRSKRFRMRFQDGTVEIGLGVLLLLETLLNESEHFVAGTQAARFLVLMQPFLSLILFVGMMYVIQIIRHRLIISRNGPKEIPLASPLLWASLLLMLLLLIAPLVWPLTSYTPQIYTFITAGLGVLIGTVLIVLGIQNQLPRFWIVGGWCVLVSGLFSFIGQPGTLPNRLVILLGISGGLIIAGGYVLLRFLRLTQPRSQSVKTTTGKPAKSKK